MDDEVRAALERYTADKYEFEESPMGAHFVMMADMADIADAYAAEHSPEPLTPERAVEMGG